MKADQTTTKSSSISSDKPKPSIGALGRWLHSWVQPDGAIHGFHNHSVWGDNPFRMGDFTAGHSTFTSPLLMGLARALTQVDDPRGQRLLDQLIHFQAKTFQPDGQFAHIGFQIGETLKGGLIHNVVPCVALLEAGRSRQQSLPMIDEAVRRVFAACDRMYRPFPSEGSVANQDYCRLWARLLHMEIFCHREWHDEVAAGLDFLIERFHVRGVPDAESAGTLRQLSNSSYLEPTEYYGLMISPLLLGFQRYGNRRYLDEAWAITNHVIRSSWLDRHKQRRVHRTWTRPTDKWLPVREPMSIGGVGITLAAIQALARLDPADELESFLTDMDRTYAHYQSDAGFFLSATGWSAEQDISPSTAWQSHDFYHLVGRHGVNATFWDSIFAEDPHVAVVFGHAMIWIESGPYWAIRGYEAMNGLNLVGRKDRVRFGIEMATWIHSGREMPAEYILKDTPRFVRTDSAIYHRGGREDLKILSAEPFTYEGPCLRKTAFTK